MFSVFRNKFGIPGVISVIALVFAMIGGAYAASSDGGGKATASAKKAKQGKRGKPGTPGAQGIPGANGSDGAPGVPGLPGANGKSVEVIPIPPLEEGCEGLGGALVKEEGAPEEDEVEVCTGEEGSPWTVDGKLPPGKTLTGTWNTTAPKVAVVDFGAETVLNTAAGQPMTASFSIPLPLASEPEPIYVGTAASAPGCPGIVGGIPTADAGKLCVYTGTQQGTTSASVFFLKPIGSFQVGASRSGTVVQFTCEQSACSKFGTWAVTAHAAP